MAEQPTVEILYEDDDLLALNKPSGLLVHPSWLTPRGTPSLATLVKQYLGFAPFTVHRLDRPTSGVILMAKNKHTAQQLNQAFADHRVEKTYLCVCRGFVPDEGVIDYPLKEERDKIADKYVAEDKPAQEAITEFRTLAQVELPMAIGRYATARYSLVEVRPRTGRKHQIRRHMKHIFHPIMGDTRHGDNKHNKVLREALGLNRLMLMASELRLDHPVTGQPLVLTAAVDAYTDGLLTRFNWQGLYPTHSQPQSQRLFTEPDMSQSEA